MRWFPSSIHGNMGPGLRWFPSGNRGGKGLDIWVLQNECKVTFNTMRHIIPIHARHVVTMNNANRTFRAEVENMWCFTHGWCRQLRWFPSSNRRPTWLRKRWFPSSLKSGSLLVEHVVKIALCAALGWFPNSRVGHQ
jgi:hypothetical protein